MLPVVTGRHCVQMAAEQQRRALSGAAQATDHARPAGFFVRHRVGEHPSALATFRHIRRHGGFIPRWIDTAHTHQIAR